MGDDFSGSTIYTSVTCLDLRVLGVFTRSECRSRVFFLSLLSGSKEGRVLAVKWLFEVCHAGV